MTLYERSKSSLFLMELLMNLLLFCFLCACGLMFFLKSNQLTTDTADLHNAVRITSTVAGVYETGDGSFDSLCCRFPDGTQSEWSFTVYYDKTYAPCSISQSRYRVLVKKDTEPPSKVTIRFFNEKEEVIYTIKAFHYTPSTLDSLKEVPQT